MLSQKRKSEAQLLNPKSKSSVKFRRSGKWSAEEEALALQLIVEFESGTFGPEDCPSGCTLRSFLSKKLSCAPMRISKKFAKKQIGKLIYTPRPNLVDDPPDHSLLKHLEDTYLASDPFDHDDSEESSPMKVSRMMDADSGTDGSISSDSEDASSNNEMVYQDDFCREMYSDTAFFENEEEEWKDVLSFYFSQHPENASSI